MLAFKSTNIHIPLYGASTWIRAFRLHRDIFVFCSLPNCCVKWASHTRYLYSPLTLVTKNNCWLVTPPRNIREDNQYRLPMFLWKLTVNGKHLISVLSTVKSEKEKNSKFYETKNILVGKEPYCPNRLLCLLCSCQDSVLQILKLNCINTKT